MSENIEKCPVYFPKAQFNTFRLHVFFIQEQKNVFTFEKLETVNTGRFCCKMITANRFSVKLID